MRPKDENEFFVRHNSINYLDLKSSLVYEPFFISTANVKAKTLYFFEEHCHPAFEMIIPENKDYKCSLNGADLVLHPGEFLLVQVNDLHQDVFDPGLNFIGITFLLRSSIELKKAESLFRKDIKPTQQINLLPENDEVFDAAYSLLKKAASSQGTFAYYVLNGIFNTVFWKIMEAIPESSLAPVFMKSARDECFKEGLIKYFELNLENKFDAGDLAGYFNMSRSSIGQKSKRLLGVGPAKAFMNYKMKKAMILLKATDLSIKEISERLAFEDQFCFSKAFKKHYGKPPSFYR
jgi:AraC-like DNA-binding protein